MLRLREDPAHPGQRAGLRAREEAYQYVLDTVWSSLEVEEVEHRIRAGEGATGPGAGGQSVAGRPGGGPSSRNWRRSWRSCRRPQGLAGNELDRLSRRHGTPVERQEEGGEEIARIEAAQTTQQSPGQAVDPDARWGALAEPAVLERFLISIRGPREGLGRAVGRGAHEGPHQSGDAGADRGVLQRPLTRPPPGSHTGLLQCLPVPSSAFASVLEHLRAQGRYHRRQEWKRHLPGWSSQDLLHRGLDTAVEEIAVEEIAARLLPVHQILATLPFGANTPRLQITVRRIRRDDLPAFGEELKHLASMVREDLTEEQARDRVQASAGLEGSAAPGRARRRRCLGAGPVAGCALAPGDHRRAARPRRGAGEHRHLLGRQERRGSPRSWWPSSSGPPGVSRSVTRAAPGPVSPRCS